MNSFLRISERHHIGMILMTELATNYDTRTFTRLPDITEKTQVVPLGYLEEIALALKKAGLIEGRTGPRGGYRLRSAPDKITTDQILTALEGPLALVACQNPKTPCPIEDQCVSRSLWSELQKSVLSTLHQTTLADLRQPAQKV